MKLKVLINIYGKVIIKLDRLPEEYVKIFKEQLYPFISDRLPYADYALIDIICTDKIDIKSDMKSFNHGWWYDQQNLYISRGRDNKLIGYAFNRTNASIIFEDGVNPFDVYVIADLLIRDLIVEFGLCFMHASCVLWEDQVLIFPAWGGTGKTNMLLSFLQNGAIFFGDDAIIFDKHGVVYPYPKPLNLLSYNFIANEKLLLPHANKQTTKYFYLLKALNKIEKVIVFFGKTMIHLYQKVKVRVENKVYEYIPAEKIFYKSRLDRIMPFDNYSIFFMLNSSEGSIKDFSMSAKDFADKISPCLRWERNYFCDLHCAYSYAFPDKAKLFEQVIIREKSIVVECSRNARNLRGLLIGLDVQPSEVFQYIKSLQV